MLDRRTARLLAPLALVAFVIVFIVVVSSSGTGGSKSSSRARTTPAAAKHHSPPKRYTVKESDTSLEEIAAKTGVPASQIVRLNPDLDPQSLAPGLRIRLRR
jgi:LysM repeat protein